MFNPKLAVCFLLAFYQGHAMANPVMEIDAAVQPQMKVSQTGEVSSCGIRIVAIRQTGLTTANTMVDGFDMSVNLFGDDQIIGASKVVYLEGRKGESLASEKRPVPTAIKSFWLRSSTKSLKDKGQFIEGEVKHSLMTGHDFLETFEFITQIMRERTMKLGLNFENSSANMAYTANIRITDQDQTELQQCIGGLMQTLEAKIN
jgi:hypothetical protein